MTTLLTYLKSSEPAGRRKLIEFVDKIETELASRAESYSFEQAQQLFYLLSEQINQALEQEIDPEVTVALRFHLLLSELRPMAESSFNSMDLPSFLAMYHVYLFSGLFAETSDAQDEAKPKYISPELLSDKDAHSITHDFKPLHESLVTDLIYRRLTAIQPSDMVLLLDFYILGQAFKGESSKKFFDICDKYIGKNSDRLTAVELETVIRLFDMQSNNLNSKILLKLQRHVLAKS